MGLCFSFKIEDEPTPRRFRQIDVKSVCVECKKEGTDVFFTEVHPYELQAQPYEKRSRRFAVIATRCGKGHEVQRKIERVGPPTIKQVSK